MAHRRIIKQLTSRRSAIAMGVGAVAALGLAALADLESFRDDHDALLARNDLQFDFTAIKPPEAPDWLLAIGRALTSVLDFLSPVLGFAFWTGLILLGAFLTFVIGRELLGSRLPAWFRRKSNDVEVQDYRPAPQRARALLSEADALAAQGRFAEAARVLLHRSIDDMEAWRPHSVRRDWTSREIAASAHLPDTARAAFVLMAQLVERAWFAGRGATQSEFAACREAYERFAFPEAWA